MVTTGLNALLLSRTSDGLLPWAEQAALVRETGLSLREIEAAALSEGIMPARYQSNWGAISIAEQITLSQAKAAVIGCGGLGGYVIEELARLGVGTIMAWDDDVIEEKNLNRQILAQFSTLGQSKVCSAGARVAAINPAVDWVGHNRPFMNGEDDALLKGVDVAIDALDNVPARLLLSQICRDVNVPLIHGALNGWYGQVLTQFPGDRYVELLYSQRPGDGYMPANQPTLSFVPAVIASLEAAQACKVILGRGDLLKGRLLAIDLLSMDMDNLEIGP